MHVSFHGGAREVTGACHLLETAQIKILIDCGMFQGSDEHGEANRLDFKFTPSAIDALIVTHAHLDHVGRIPKLVRDGFRGVIYSTAATRELARPILEDALHLAEREDDALYTMGDIDCAFAQWQDVGYGVPWTVGDATMQLKNAGHILGSSIVMIIAEGKRVVFTGDLGNVPSILLPPPDAVTDAEYLIIESTYGSRTHEEADKRVLLLERAVEDVAARGGTLLIPAFATERTQDILHLLNEMVYFKRIPEMPMFVDAPLATRITDVFEHHIELYNPDVQKLYREHPHLFKFKRLKFTESVEESKAINDVRPPKVILAGSGMMTGGRVLHHARRYLPDPKSILLITGYQSGGSLGRRLVEGEKTVKIAKEEITVRAEIRTINGFSAHADNPQLFAFITANRDTLKRVFVVQGEEAEADHLAQEVKDRLGIPAESPALYEEAEI